MKLFSFFKKKKISKAEVADTSMPSPEQALFGKAALTIIGQTIEGYGFVKHAMEIKAYSTNIVFRKAEQYIKIYSTNYPLDYPYYYNVILGEGDSENFIEWDWNSIALWQIAKAIDPNALISSYDFPINENVEPSIQQANADLLKYGVNFLEGDLKQFHIVRSEMNQKREAYKILSKDQNGIYISADDMQSAEQKRKYS
ncbi:MAG: hypothetical protein ACTHJ0_17300 [Flavipsychrobacter sp.]